MTVVHPNGRRLLGELEVGYASPFNRGNVGRRTAVSSIAALFVIFWDMAYIYVARKGGRDEALVKGGRMTIRRTELHKFRTYRLIRGRGVIGHKIVTLGEL